MIHLNGNILCAVDIETTGLDPRKHDIIQVCVLPLDSVVKPHPKFMPFNLKLKPSRPENIDFDAFRVNKRELSEVLLNGLDPDMAADLFNEWFQLLRLPERKRISPLGQNIIFDMAFIREWLGPLNMEYYFDGRYRDTQATALYLNDVADYKSEQVPFPKVNLQYLARTLRVQLTEGGSHDALYDCMTCAEIYRRQIRMCEVPPNFASSEITTPTEITIPENPSVE